MLHEFVASVKDTVTDTLKGVHTVFPGELVSYDTETGLAVVQPVMKFYSPGGKSIDYPKISGVPVVFPQTAGQQATIAYALHPGDTGMIAIGEEALDYWMYGQETATKLAFDLTNAIFIPGMWNLANVVMKEACDEDAVIVQKGSSRVKLKDNSITIYTPGDINITAGGNVTITGTTINLN